MSVHDCALDMFDITDPQDNRGIESKTRNICVAKDVGIDSAGAYVSHTRSSETARSSDLSKGFSLRKNPTGESSHIEKKQPTRSSNMQAQSTVTPYPEFMCVKGAPDVLLPKCSHFVVTLKGGKGHKVLPADTAWRSCVTAAFEEMAAQVFDKMMLDTYRYFILCFFVGRASSCLCYQVDADQRG